MIVCQEEPMLVIRSRCLLFVFPFHLWAKRENRGRESQNIDFGSFGLQATGGLHIGKV
jgi:hypothetical protein